LAPDWAERQTLPSEAEVQQELDVAVDSAIGDETLRLLFLCCHESIPAESRVALALKTVGGFSVKEIASGLLTTADNIEKRLGRARERLRQDRQSLTELTTTGVAQRLETVLSTVYLIFNEGYSASQGQTPLRRDLCDEALRQSHMLAAHPICGQPASCALHALLLLHSARLDSRLTPDGQVVLLADQNRESWNWDNVRSALEWLRRSATGTQLSRYHIEAAIAWEHCRAPDFAATDWKRIAECYERLVHEWSTPMIRLNQAIAVSYAQSAEQGIQLLLAIDAVQRRPIRPWWDCALAQMYQRSGAIALALAHWRDALALAVGPAQRDVIAKHLGELEEQTQRPGL
jgi:RNA polymerase sigma-70 factor (ECF subfamily)